MCQFSHLNIGDDVNFHGDYCGYCGERIDIDTVATYAGHVVDGYVYDVFKTIPFRCPHCRGLCTTSFIECDGGPEIDVDIFARKVNYVEQE